MAGNEDHERHIIKNENRKDMMRKSCRRNEPSLLYDFRENEGTSGEGFGGTASSSHYLYIDACPKRKVKYRFIILH